MNRVGGLSTLKNVFKFMSQNVCKELSILLKINRKYFGNRASSIEPLNAIV